MGPVPLAQAHANLIERARLSAGLIDGGAVEESDGAVLIALGPPLPAANSA